VSWLRDEKGRNCFAPCTGQDFLAWETFVHAANLYGLANATGKHAAVTAMRGAVEAMQPGLRHLIRDVIPCILDWSSLLILWPQVSSVDVLDDNSPATHVDQIRSLRQAAPALASAGAPGTTAALIDPRRAV
jgi:hypothetical protein